MSRSLVLVSLLTVAILSDAFSTENPTDRRVLVLLDDFAIKSSHSLYFNSLQSRGFDLDFKLADDPKIALQRYGQYLYDALILFSPSTDRKFSLSLLFYIALNIWYLTRNNCQICMLSIWISVRFRIWTKWERIEWNRYRKSICPTIEVYLIIISTTIDGKCVCLSCSQHLEFDVK